MGIYGSLHFRKYSTRFVLLVFCSGFVNNYSLADTQISRTSMATDDVQEAALLTACGFEAPPSYENPFYTDANGNTEINKRWRWEPTNRNLRGLRFERTRYLDASYTNPVCELWAQKKLSQQGNSSVIAQRCRAKVAPNLSKDGPANRGSLNFGALDGFGGSRGSSGMDICESYDGASGPYAFACSYLEYQAELANEGAQKRAADAVLENCRKVGANMNSRYDMATYQRMTDAGIDINGGVYCGPRTMVINNQPSFAHSALNAFTAIAKVGIPALAMYNLGKKQQKNAELAINHNAALGFPSAVNAGSAGYIGGYGMGGGFGYGVGMGGMPGYPGMPGGGGMCGVPPYAPWYPGCGAGGGVGGGGWGGGYGGYPYGMGVGGHPFGMGYGTGGVGFPGPFGTLNGGNGWGMGGGGMGPGMGGGAFPGPFGTINGGNGWGGAGVGGNPWGAGGQFGGAPFWGAGNPGNADMLAAQAGFWEQQAARARQQASMAQQAATIYEQTQQDMRDVSKKNQQAYLAYQMALSGYGAGSIPGSGTTAGGPVPTPYGSGYGSGYGFGYGTGQRSYYGSGSSYYAPTYYPGYQGGAGGGGGNFSLWGSYSGRR